MRAKGGHGRDTVLCGAYETEICQAIAPSGRKPDELSIADERAHSSECEHQDFALEGRKFQVEKMFASEQKEVPSELAQSEGTREEPTPRILDPGLEAAPENN